MANDKKKPITVDEKLNYLDRALMSLNSVFAMYVNFNGNMKDFQEFMKKESEKSQKEEAAKQND